VKIRQRYFQVSLYGMMIFCDKSVNERLPI
jgi:hypothetical protein